MPMHFCGKMTAGLFPLLFLFIARVLIAQETNGKPLAGGAVITNMAQFWELPSEEKDQLHRIRMELLIYYCDSKWTVFWGQSDGLDTFLPLRGIPVPLRAGQKVLIDGFSLPVNQEVLWDKTTVKILSESNELKSVSAKGRLFDTSTLDKHFVELEALVDSQRLISTNILRLDLLAQNFNFTANVLMDQPETNPPDFSGNFVRIDGVYSATFDALGKIASITLWTDGLHFVVTNGSLGSDSRFTLPITSSENFATFDPNALAHVQGIVRSQQPGQAVTIWDNAGQIRIYSKQEYPLQVGERIEAVGYPAFQGIDRVLQGGLFRLTAGKEVGPKEISDGHSKLRLADQVRGLDQETIAQRLPVSLEGVVTWVDPRRNFIFILDSSGGIRVMRPQNPDGRRLRAGMLVKVNGVTAMGEFTPAITNATVRQTGTMSLPDPPLVSLEEAMTGTEDGRWIQMRGYVRKSSEETNSIRLQLVAPGGEFIARIPKDNTLRTLNGSVVLVRGVCVVTANARRQLTGIQIWSPEVSDVQIEQSAPADVFALPLRTLASLRQFKQMLQRRPLDVPEALNNLSKMLRRIIGEHIYLRIQCADHLPLVFADAVNFEQIIINLAVNARDAMPRGGPLTITADRVVIDAKYQEREPDAVIGTFVRLSVADEGSGMSETVRKKIFEPFFTTKEVGKGTGMGLATVYGIVKQHQGWIEVESRPGVGSVFRVFLPVAEEEAQKKSESGNGRIGAADVQPRTIFLVEDEAPLREMASMILKRLGHAVVVAQDGQEALSLWPQHRGKIDLLLTDMVMPGGISGRELADQLLRESPGMRVIYSTGYSMDLSSSDIKLVEGVNCLPKPYDATTLIRMVEKALANGNGH